MPWRANLSGSVGPTAVSADSFLAAARAAEPGWRSAPEPPQVNAFQLHLPVAPDALREALLDVARRERFWLGARAVASHVLEGGAMVEVVIGDAAQGWTDSEALAAWRAAVMRAAGATRGDQRR